MYYERRSELPGAVVWHAVSSGLPSRIMPDGCVDVIWMDGRLVVAGPDVTARVVVNKAGSTAVGLRFAPGQGLAAVGVPASELVSEVIELAAVVGDACARRLSERLAAGEPGRALEAAFLQDAVERDDARRAAVVAALRAGQEVDTAAALAGLSVRQLHRRSQSWFGYGPKLLARVLRFQQALELAREGVGLSAVAALSGYADQAHLARDSRMLAGVPMSELLAS